MSARPRKAFRTDGEEFALYEVCSTIGGMTVAEMTQRMSNKEFMKWVVFISEKRRLERRATKPNPNTRGAKLPVLPPGD